MAVTKRIESFQGSDIAGMAREMAALAARPSGDIWVNVGPDIDVDEVPEGSAFYRMFSSRGPLIPVATWVPVLGERAATHKHQVGVAHGTGEKAAERLQRNGVPQPPEWFVAQDHKKRGLIYGVPPTQDTIVALRFMADAVKLLSPFDFGDDFRITFAGI